MNIDGDAQSTAGRRSAACFNGAVDEHRRRQITATQDAERSERSLQWSRR